MLLLLPLLALMPRLLLPVLDSIEGPIDPEPLVKLDPLLFDDPDDELELLVDERIDGAMLEESLCAHTPSTSRVLVGGTWSATGFGPTTTRGSPS